jgi:hypothetical protein
VGRGVERRDHGFHLAERPPVVHAVAPDERLLGDDAGVVRLDQLAHGQRALVVVGHVHVPLRTVPCARRVLLRCRVGSIRPVRGGPTRAVDHDRRTALAAANLDDLPFDLLVGDVVLGLAGLAGNLHVRPALLEV